MFLYVAGSYLIFRRFTCNARVYKASSGLHAMLIVAVLFGLVYVSICVGDSILAVRCG
jgi:hypothetical protein